MASKINYNNKAPFQTLEEIPDENKVNAADMNEIKQVVNTNADELNTAKENIENLQGGQGTSNAEITSLKNRVSTLETDNTQNKSDINTLKSDNQTNKSNISTMQEQISDIQQGQSQQNTDIENLQTNDNKQDDLISKLKQALINVETEESKSIHIEDVSELPGQLEVLGNDEQDGEPSPINPVPVVCVGSNADGTFKGSTEIKIRNEDETEEISKVLNIQQEMLQGDYFVKEDAGWKEVHNWKKYIETNAENFTVQKKANDSTFNFIRNVENGNNLSVCICNMFKYWTGDWTKTSCFISYTSQFYAIIKFGEYGFTEDMTEEQALQKFEELLATNSLIFYYKTTTETKLPCTEEQTAVLEELNNLELFEGVNNIITTEDIALLKLKYIADTKTYIDNKLNTINQQILEIAGGN